VEISIVGAGTVGTAFAVLLAGAGADIPAVSGREATRGRVARYLPDVPVLAPGAAAAAGELVLIATPDDRIAVICREIFEAGGFRRGQTVAHLSGATGLDALGPAIDAGAAPLSLHPLQTFPSVDAALARLPGATIAVTARDDVVAALGERVARDVGAEPFRLPEEAKPLYHAAAVFASNFVVAIAGVAEALFTEAGLREPLERFLPLSRASLEHAAELGPAAAMTGPAIRGDAGTVERNLAALEAAAPDDVESYVALTRIALDVGERSGRLAPEGRARVEDVLARWS
jgi:predicted short-subunit dehydrogenase-like oxidoreductase (DUF2520 family)